MLLVLFNITMVLLVLENSTLQMTTQREFLKESIVQIKFTLKLFQSMQMPTVLKV